MLLKHTGAEVIERVLRVVDHLHLVIKLSRLAETYTNSHTLRAAHDASSFVALVAGGCLIAIASLCMLRAFVLYVGFVQFPAGTGSLLIFLGVLDLGTGVIGTAVGGFSIGWGVINILAHLWLRKRAAAVNMPLLR